MAKYTVKKQLEMGEAVKLAWSKLTKCKGRSRRSEFWWTMLTIFLVSIIPIIGWFLFPLLMLAEIPLKIRRLHDTNRSGWWVGASILTNIALLTSYFINIYSLVTSGYFERLNPEDPTASMEIFSQLIGGPTAILYIASIVLSITLLVFYLQDSNVGPNKYGESPKYETVKEGELEI